MPEWKINEDTTPYLQYAAGSIVHPETKLLQLWVTFDGYHVNWVAAYYDQNRIEMVMHKLSEAIRVGERFSREKALTVLDTLYEGREEDPQPVPFYIEETIRRNMASR